ncbi:MAG: hypothetical protein AAF843_14505 [Bacteroidota bacterium]
MKLPSLFRTPRYQRFHVEPRYYDPVKEEMDKRTEAIRRELGSGKDELDRPSGSSRIAGSFKMRKSANTGSATVMQLVIMLLLISVIFGYLYVGNLALYIFALLATVLVYLKMKRII